MYCSVLNNTCWVSYGYLNRWHITLTLSNPLIFLLSKVYIGNWAYLGDTISNTICFDIFSAIEPWDLHICYSRRSQFVESHNPPDMQSHKGLYNHSNKRVDGLTYIWGRERLVSAPGSAETSSSSSWPSSSGLYDFFCLASLSIFRSLA